MHIQTKFGILNVNPTRLWSKHEKLSTLLSLARRWIGLLASFACGFSMFSQEVVELRESTARNMYLTPTEQADGGESSKSSTEQVKKNQTCYPHTRSTCGVYPCLQLQGFINQRSANLTLRNHSKKTLAKLFLPKFVFPCALPLSSFASVPYSTQPEVQHALFTHSSNKQKLPFSLLYPMRSHQPS